MGKNVSALEYLKQANAGEDDKEDKPKKSNLKRNLAIAGGLGAAGIGAAALSSKVRDAAKATKRLATSGLPGSFYQHARGERAAKNLASALAKGK